MKPGGYIALHRSLLEHPLANQLPAAWFRIFIVILLKANWKSGTWWDGKQEVEIPRGSIVISLDKLAKISGSGVQQVRSALKYLQATRMITLVATRSYTAITVVNWCLYQENGRADNTPSNTPGNEPITQRQHSDNTAVTAIEEEGNKGIREIKQAGSAENSPPASPDGKRKKTLASPDHSEEQSPPASPYTVEFIRECDRRRVDVSESEWTPDLVQLFEAADVVPGLAAQIYTDFLLRSRSRLQAADNPKAYAIGAMRDELSRLSAQRKPPAMLRAGCA